MMKRSLSLSIFGSILINVALAVGAHAQNYPNRPITFVVPFAPGGLTDVPARVLAAIMQEKIGASIVVENKTGASGVVGATHVWRAEPDPFRVRRRMSPHTTRTPAARVRCRPARAP